jgi:hypothetical protein
MLSAELGLLLEVEDHLLRLVDPSTGDRLPTDVELADEARLARQETKKAKREANIAKRRIAELEAELARLRRSPKGGSRSS